MQINIGDKVSSGTGETQKVIIDSGSSLIDYLQSEKQADARKKELMDKERKAAEMKKAKE